MTLEIIRVCLFHQLIKSSYNGKSDKEPSKKRISSEQRTNLSEVLLYTICFTTTVSKLLQAKTELTVVYLGLLAK